MQDDRDGCGEMGRESGRELDERVQATRGGSDDDDALFWQNPLLFGQCGGALSQRMSP